MIKKLQKTFIIIFALSAVCFLLIFKIANSMVNVKTIINNGEYNAKSEKIRLSVTYSGVCNKSSFKLATQASCRETYPVQCDFKLVHKAFKSDYCFDLTTKEIELSLPKEVLKDNYYKNAYFKVLGDDNTSFSFQIKR